MKKGSMLIHLCRVIIGMLFLIAIYFVQISIAAEKANLATKKTAPKKTQCWKRLPPLEKELMSPEYSTMCKAYEEVLNKTCEPPEKLQCNWTLPPGEKRFKKLEWHTLASKEYLDLIRDMRVSGVREDQREIVWGQDGARIRKLFEEGKRVLLMTSIDIDHDGHTEEIVRTAGVPCADHPGVTFAVKKSETKRIDWLLNKVFFDLNAFNEGADIMLYNGKTFMVKIEKIYYESGSSPSKEIRAYKGFSLFGGSSFGSINICRFEYLKGRK